jgi:hypothetical protein
LDDNFVALLKSITTASGENADRKREIAFTCDPFMLFSETLNAVAGVARLSQKRRAAVPHFHLRHLDRAEWQI